MAALLGAIFLVFPIGAGLAHDFGTTAGAPSDPMTEFHRIVSKACASDLRNRYATAEAMHAELLQLEEQLAPKQPRS